VGESRVGGGAGGVGGEGGGGSANFGPGTACAHRRIPGAASSRAWRVEILHAEARVLTATAAGTRKAARSWTEQRPPERRTK